MPQGLHGGGQRLGAPSFARAQRLVAIDQAAQGERDARMHGRGRRRGTLIDALGELAGGDPRFGQAQRREVAKNIAPILAADAMPQRPCASPRSDAQRQAGDDRVPIFA